MVKRIPLSEDVNRQHLDWSKDDCIRELQRIAEENPEQVITRNFFRNNSQISESTWNRYFGTFAEFKKQANIVLSRHAQGLEKHIAKHASKDNQRKMTIEKMSFEGDYLRGFDNRFQTILCGSDIHDVECDPFYREMFLEACKRVQPEKIILNGDIFDLTEFGKYTQDPREYKPIERIKWVHKFLEDIRDNAPNSELTMVEGNHEFRLLRHLTEATPALVTVLSDLHGMTVPDLLGIKKYEINYIARMDLAAFSNGDVNHELRKNYYIAYDCVLFHHFPHGFDMGYPGVNGHHHKHLVKSAYSPIFGTYEWHQLGSGHKREASYTAGEKWGNGFILCHVDTHTKRTQFEYVDTTHDFCIMGGKFYKREKI
jgi:hypothetical protein